MFNFKNQVAVAVSIATVICFSFACSSVMAKMTVGIKIQRKISCVRK